MERVFEPVSVFEEVSVEVPESVCVLVSEREDDFVAVMVSVPVKVFEPVREAEEVCVAVPDNDRVAVSEIVPVCVPVMVLEVEAVCV